MNYPEDKVIKDLYLKVQKEYGKSESWNMRIIADELKCPIRYVRGVLLELEEKGEI